MHIKQLLLLHYTVYILKASASLSNVNCEITKHSIIHQVYDGVFVVGMGMCMGMGMGMGMRCLYANARYGQHDQIFAFRHSVANISLLVLSKVF